MKDLRIIADREVKDMIIVDNSIISFAFNMENGVPIAAFTGQEEDDELLYLMSFLEESCTFNDVREHVSKTFKLNEMLKKYGVKKK